MRDDVLDWLLVGRIKVQIWNLDRAGFSRFFDICEGSCYLKNIARKFGSKVWTERCIHTRIHLCTMNRPSRGNGGEPSAYRHPSALYLTILVLSVYETWCRLLCLGGINYRRRPAGISNILHKIWFSLSIHMKNIRGGRNVDSHWLQYCTGNIQFGVQSSLLKEARLRSGIYHTVLLEWMLQRGEQKTNHPPCSGRSVLRGATGHGTRRRFLASLQSSIIGLAFFLSQNSALPPIERDDSIVLMAHALQRKSIVICYYINSLRDGLQKKSISTTVILWETKCRRLPQFLVSCFSPVRTFPLELPSISVVVQIFAYHHDPR